MSRMTLTREAVKRRTRTDLRTRTSEEMMTETEEPEKVTETLKTETNKTEKKGSKESLTVSSTFTTDLETHMDRSSIHTSTTLITQWAPWEAITTMTCTETWESRETKTVLSMSKDSMTWIEKENIRKSREMKEMSETRDLESVKVARVTRRTVREDSTEIRTSE
jgi:hypothetical protein